jgi:hypothetical protein
VGKKVVLIIRLIPEAEQQSAKEIQRDIEAERREILRVIPWASEIEKIEVIS